MGRIHLKRNLRPSQPNLEEEHWEEKEGAENRMKKTENSSKNQ